MRGREPIAALVIAVVAGSTFACKSRKSPDDAAGGVLVALPEPEQVPTPRANMVWIPAGVFIAGTAPDRSPRAPDAELPGVQVALRGFYIDKFPFPNESGAIQTTNVTRNEAQAHCESADKRLCTELEWERACKGPKSTTYAYGDSFRATDCGGSSPGSLLPTGTRAACRSAFDVYDLHGGAFEWTSNAWARGDARDLVAVRGGSGVPQDVIGRCANVQPRTPSQRRPDIGFRCCAGPANEAVVDLEVTNSAEPLKVTTLSPSLVMDLEREVPKDLVGRATVDDGAKLRIDHAWRWYPVGNEEIVVVAGCVRPTTPLACGLALGRVKGDDLERIASVSSGSYSPNVQVDDDRRVLWVYGGETTGKYNRQVMYLWGRIGVGEPDFDFQSKMKKKKRGRSTAGD